MNVHEFLHEQSSAVLAEAESAIVRSRLRHYEEGGKEQTHQRLKALLVLTTRAIQEKNLGPIIAHAEQVASERFQAGFDLWEVQTAFNVLEEAIWKKILESMPPSQMAEALGLVSTVLGAGKDALARTYVSLASRTRASSLNLESLFSGIA
jgi:hypothetical protein